jgi:hypothetical protein
MEVIKVWVASVASARASTAAPFLSPLVELCKLSTRVLVVFRTREARASVSLIRVSRADCVLVKEETSCRRVA